MNIGYSGEREERRGKMDDWFYFGPHRPLDRTINDGNVSALIEKSKKKAKNNEAHDKRKTVPKRQSEPTP